MSRATTVYVVMIVALVGGLWAVLSIGGRLSAPEDLAGRWELSPGQAVSVEQSGKFFQLTFGPDKPVDLTLAKAEPAHVQLTGHNGWSVAFDGPVGGDEKVVTVVGPKHAGRYDAHRTARTFPAAAAPTTAPTTREGSK